MASRLFREESKLKGLSGVKTEQGRAGLNVREVKQPAETPALHLGPAPR